MDSVQTIHLPSSSNVLRQGLQEVEQQLQVLGVDLWRGTTLKQLDKGLRAHKDLALNAYLYWLHENPIKGDPSRPTVHKSLVQSWCDRLRSYGFDNRNIYGAFKHWAFVQVTLDSTSDTNYEILDEMLSFYLKIPHYEFPCPPDNQDTRAKREIMEKHLVIEVSSGEDSDVEFLGYGMQDNKRDDRGISDNKMKNEILFEKSAATKENRTRLEPDPTLQLNVTSKESKIKKNTNSRDLTWEYICKRCHKPGHHLIECPTNLDPSYDTKPVDQYKCAICGAVGEHYGTLCPKNTAPWSLNQVRLKHGISTGGGKYGNDNGHHVSHDAPTKVSAATRKRPREAATHASHSDGHGMADMEYDADHIHESRRALVDHARSRQQSPKDGRKIGRRGEGHRNSPPHKHLGREKEGSESVEERAVDRENGHCHKARRDKRRCLDRIVRVASLEETRSGDSHHTRSSELLSAARHDKETNGRLSYWDDEYSSPYYEDKGPIADEPGSGLSRNSDIEWIFPGCDPLWEHDMTTFDLEKFLEGLNECLISFEQEQWRRSMMAPRILRGAKFQGRPSNEAAPFDGSCNEGPQAREMENDGKATSQEFGGTFGPRLENEPDGYRACSDRYEGVSPAVRAAVWAARVVPPYTDETED